MKNKFIPRKWRWILRGAFWAFKLIVRLVKWIWKRKNN